MKSCSYRYDYITTHIDDIMIVPKDSKQYTNTLANFSTLKTEGNLEYFFGNNYKKKESGLSKISLIKCIERAIAKVEDIYMLSLL